MQLKTAPRQVLRVYATWKVNIISLACKRQRRTSGKGAKKGKETWMRVERTEGKKGRRRINTGSSSAYGPAGGTKTGGKTDEGGRTDRQREKEYASFLRVSTAQRVNLISLGYKWKRGTSDAFQARLKGSR